MNKRVQRAYAKFARLAVMNAAIDAGGDAAVGVAKAKRKLSDTWTKRVSRNTKGFFDPKKARRRNA